MRIILIYVVVVAVIAGLPMVLDMLLAYLSLYFTRRHLICKAALNNLEQKELDTILKQCSAPPPGIPGLARSMMALTVIVILGVAVFHVLTSVNGENNSPIVNNVLSMLAGLLAAITGFYFGGKSGEKKMEEVEKKIEKVDKKIPG